MPSSFKIARKYRKWITKNKIQKKDKTVDPETRQVILPPGQLDNLLADFKKIGDVNKKDIRSSFYHPGRQINHA
ncbi:MAG: hypothetical protein LBF22_09125, partial [Deltaproteobacteria bacterium]|nr:hypothetical protein [Deltaproteobacteria bacterium]